MPKLIFLGTSNALADAEHENTHMILLGKSRTLLVDCVSSPIVRLERVGVDPLNVTDLILTHFHPDHVSGVPLLLMDMWLMGRKSSLSIYGLDYTLNRIEQLMEGYGWSNWPHLFPVIFHRLPEEERTPVFECSQWRVFSSPVCHMIPAIGLRIEFSQTGQVLAYSCDTSPCPQVVRLAQNADVLIHESTGEVPGHSSASQAGEIAAQAGAKSLYLIHYDNRQADPSGLIPQAQLNFSGKVNLAQDFMELNF